MSNYNLQTEIPKFLQGEDLPGDAISIGVEAFEMAAAEKGEMSLDEAKQIAMSAIEKYYTRTKNGWQQKSSVVEKMIKKENGKFVLYSKDGSKKLGTFETKEQAEEREKEINQIKHAKKGLISTSFVITKASLQQDGTMRWQAVASDTEQDSKGEATSLVLFQDWMERVEKNIAVPFLPEPRMPFLGISHYSDLNGFGEAGVTENWYIDGNRFKVNGVFLADSPIGKALFEAIKKDPDLVKKGEVDYPIRISAAWYDLLHMHGNFAFERKNLTEKCPMCEGGQPVSVYLKGQADHWAATRVPVNKRTSVELVEKAMTTRKEDAASIVGDELAQELEEKSQMVGKSEALVVKARDKKKADEEEKKMTENEEEEEKEVNYTTSSSKKKKADVVEKMEDEMMHMPFGGATSMAAAMEWMEAQSKLDQAYDRLHLFQAVLNNIGYLPPNEQLSAIKAATEEMNDQLMAIKSAVVDLFWTETINDFEEENEVKNMDAQYKAIFDGVEETLKGNVTRQEAEAKLQKSLSDLAQVMRAELDKKYPTTQTNQGDMVEAFKAAISPLADQISLLNAKLTGQQQVNYQVPQQKSFATPVMNQQPPAQDDPNSFRAIARRSVGLY